MAQNKDQKDQKDQVQERNNTDLASKITTGVGGNLKKGFTGMNKTMRGLFSKKVEDISEGKRAIKLARNTDQKTLIAMNGILKMSKSQKIAAKAGKAVANKLASWWKLLLAVSLIFVPWKTVLPKLKQALVDVAEWLKSIDWEETWSTLKQIFQSTFKVIGYVLEKIWKWFLKPMVGMIFGKKEKDENDPTGFKDGGKLQGGLFGANSGWFDKLIGGSALVVALTSLIAPIAAFNVACWMFSKAAGLRSLAGGKMLGGIRDLQAVGASTPEQLQMSNDRAANAKKVGPRTGKTPPKPKAGGSWFKSLIGRLGSFGTYLLQVGRGVVTGLMSMGPWGWGILVGIALGIMVYAYWDDIVKSFKDIWKGITNGIDKIKEFASSIVDGAQEIVGNFLRSVGAGMIADWLDPKRADTENPPTEFTWGGFAGEMWAIYSGMWGKIFDLLTFADLRSKLAGWLRSHGAGIFANWIDPDKDKKTEEKITPLNIMKEYSIVIKEVWTKIANLIRKINPVTIVKEVVAGFVKGAKAFWGDIKSSFGGDDEEDEGSQESPKESKRRTSKSRRSFTPEWLQEKRAKRARKKKTKDAAMERIRLKNSGKSNGGNLKTGVTGAITSMFSGNDGGATTSIPDDGGTTDMGGVKWNKMSPEGRKGVESAIWSIYNKHGKKPTFVSGLRDKNHELYNPNSSHAHGMGFDLRSRGLGDKKGAIAADLSTTFNQAGWFMQEEEAGQSNSTGTRATGDHFHIHKAAKGFHGWVNEATGFIAGEAGRERVDITPITNPQSRTDAMNNLHRENAEGKITSNAAPVIVSSPTTTTVSNNTQPLVMSPTAKSPVPL